MLTLTKIQSSLANDYDELVKEWAFSGHHPREDTENDHFAKIFNTLKQSWKGVKGLTKNVAKVGKRFIKIQDSLDSIITGPEVSNSKVVLC